jgi:hypothetical protein
MKHLDHYVLLVVALVGTGWFVVKGELAVRRARRAEAPVGTTPENASAASPLLSVSDAMIAAAMLSFGAGVIHAFVVQQHLRETTLFGLFFLVLALLQVAWAVAVRIAPSRGLLVAGAAGSVLIALVWLVSRTIGLPVGPERWAAEPVGLADSISTAFELGVAGLTVVALRSRSALSFVTPVLGRSFPAVTAGLAIGLTYLAATAASHHA